MRVLNLYSGIGGNRKLWENCDVTAVENNPEIAAIYQKLNTKDTVVVGDAHEYLLNHYDEFDFIWSSPPCQTHSIMNKATRHPSKRYPDLRLYEEIIFLTHFCKKIPWVVENVKPYYEPLIQPTTRVGRHLFWSNKHFYVVDVPRPSNFINLTTLKGRKVLMDWLGIHFKEVVYYGNSHCPSRILRDCVHPQIGKQIADQLWR